MLHLPNSKLGTWRGTCPQFMLVVTQRSRGAFAKSFNLCKGVL